MSIKNEHSQRRAGFKDENQFPENRENRDVRLPQPIRCAISRQRARIEVAFPPPAPHAIFLKLARDETDMRATALIETCRR
jgi:hypothetical protein